MPNVTRRLPIYLLLDCSGSMVGEPIEALKQGLTLLSTELKGVPQAVEQAYLSVITFDSTARQVVPLTELMSFQEPALNASGGTSMGAALNLLDERLRQEVRHSSEGQKGDYLPLVFLMTDGQPTDQQAFNDAAARLRRERRALYCALAAGSSARPDVLKALTDDVLVLSTLTGDSVRSYFKWVSSLAQRVSVRPGQTSQTFHQQSLPAEIRPAP